MNQSGTDREDAEMSNAMHDFTRSRPVRAALARGLAKGAFDRAHAEGADIRACLDALAALAPNARACARVGGRLARKPGVLRVGAAPGGKGLTVLLRNVQRLTVAPEDGTAFAETSLVYLRASVLPGGGRTKFGMGFLVFGPHALARFVARSDAPLDRGLLPLIDGEAAAAFRRMLRGGLIEDGARHAVPATAPGLWCGRLRWWRRSAGPELVSTPDPAAGGDQVPVLYLRTFLSPGQMNPVLAIRWESRAGGTEGGVTEG